MGKLLKLKAVSLLEQALATTPYDVTDIKVHDYVGDAYLVTLGLTIKVAEVDGVQEREITDALRGLKLHAQLSVQQPVSDDVFEPGQVDMSPSLREEIEYNQTLVDTGELDVQEKTANEMSDDEYNREIERQFPEDASYNIGGNEEEFDIGDLEMPQTKLVRRKVGEVTKRGRPKGAKNLKNRGDVKKVNVQGGRELPELDKILKDEWDEVDVEEE